MSTHAGTQHGDVLCLRGQGLPACVADVNDANRGNHHVTVSVVIPAPADPNPLPSLDSSSTDRAHSSPAGVAQYMYRLQTALDDVSVAYSQVMLHQLQAVHAGSDTGV